MNKDDIIRMADEADLSADQKLQCIGEYHPDWHEVRDMRFAALVAAAERNECAALVDANAMACENPIYRSLLQANAQAIRETGQP